ncbi:hypothetical protein EST38_g2442 [Candolleomyces aberdarensis]|uniref:Extracellular metalloproteinase n=1 Tax=Candolleomyces aberdarensis TaxID=2316362 RepID=A0A4Q2DW00_9AGAR|nr:hypothetical protein EST38_g2442 [Candolleomyces aberdarensis]
MAPIRLLSSVLLALAYISATSAAPSPDVAYTHSTHHTRSIGTRGLEIEVYNPPSSYETFGEGLPQPASLTKRAPEDEARSFVSSRLNVDESAVEYRSGYSSANGRFAYVRQRHNGIPFANAVANVAFKGDRAVTFGSSFVRPKRIASSRPTVSVESFLPKIEAQLEGKWNNHPITLQYLARPDSSAALVHVVQIQNEEVNSWYEAYVDAHSGELLSVTDFTAEASYRVLPLKKQDIRQGLELLVDPQDTLASPQGWHASGTTVTAGNNVVAYKSSQSSTTSQSASSLIFDYTYNTSQAPSTTLNVNAARTNAFYVINAVHDVAYRYGFNEAAFNFQTNNFGKGGSGNDRVLMSVQDSSGTNNANFATPPDGQSGTCRMYIWTSTTPNRDGSLSNDIIVHEMTHGITNRMTGGGTGRCLQSTEARGMGEGWSDALAEWTQQKSATIQDYVLADYVTNNPAGIRTRPYSTSATTNPLRYSNVAGLTAVHRIGEIWANILHNVYASLVGQYGFSSSAFTNPDGREGNIVWGHLFFDSLALQPCNPTFVQARDAWIQADQNRYAGANRCLLWRAFASRGLGVNARNFVDDSSVPSGC